MLCRDGQGDTHIFLAMAHEQGPGFDTRDKSSKSEAKEFSRCKTNVDSDES